MRSTHTRLESHKMTFSMHHYHQALSNIIYREYCVPTLPVLRSTDRTLIIIINLTLIWSQQEWINGTSSWSKMGNRQTRAISSSRCTCDCKIGAGLSGNIHGWNQVLEIGMKQHIICSSLPPGHFMTCFLGPCANTWRADEILLCRTCQWRCRKPYLVRNVRASKKFGKSHSSHLRSEG